MTEQKAEAFALKAHGDQKYGNKPYAYHLEAVVKVAKNLNLSEEIIMGCWLHDTIEDCDVSYQDVKKSFGENVAEIVYAVTDELGRNRKERKIKTYPKLKVIEAAICVKLCDRIANLNQTITENNKRLLSLYLSEDNEFKKQLFNPSQNKKTLELWVILDKLVSKAKLLNI